MRAAFAAIEKTPAVAASLGGLSVSEPKFKPRRGTRLVVEASEMKAISTICSLFTVLSPTSKQRVASALRTAAGLAEMKDQQHESRV